MSERPLLEVSDLTVSVRTATGGLTIVQQVSLDVSPGEILCLVGESGSGKSVTMLAIMQLMDRDQVDCSGSVRLGGTELLTASPDLLRRVRGQEVAMIFQDPMTSLNPVYPVGFQIAEQIRAHSAAGTAEAARTARELLVSVGIPEPARRMKAFPHELSGGMRQRVMIAMALSCEPGLLIADEPTTALDVTVQAQILQLIADQSEQRGMAVILVTHDMGVVAEMADRIQVMYGGRVVEEGAAADILDHPMHPYTEGLLASIPRLDQPRPARLSAIPGTPAAAGMIAAGCVFAARCAYRFAACGVQPVLLTADHGSWGPDTHRPHRVACHRHDPAQDRR